MDHARAEGLYRETDGWGTENSARVRYPDGSELDLSRPEYEAAECRHKAGALIAAAREAARIAAEPDFGQ